MQNHSLRAYIMYQLLLTLHKWLKFCPSPVKFLKFWIVVMNIIMIRKERFV